MSVLFYGTTGEVYTAFGVNPGQAGSSSEAGPGLFLGSPDDFNKHADWPMQRGAHAPGQSLYGSHFSPDNSKKHHIVTHDYAYINDEGQPCAMSLHYCKDRPTHWIFSLVTGTNLDHSQQTLHLLSSKRFVKPKQECAHLKADKALTTIREQLKSKLAETFFQVALPNRRDAGVDSRCSIFDHVAQIAKEGVFPDNRPIIDCVLEQLSGSEDRAQAILKQRTQLDKLGHAGATLAQKSLFLRREGAVYEWLRTHRNASNAILALVVYWNGKEKALDNDLLNDADFSGWFEEHYRAASHSVGPQVLMDLIVSKPELGKSLVRLPPNVLQDIQQYPACHDAVVLLMQLGCYDFSLDELREPRNLNKMAALREILNEPTVAAEHYPQLLVIIRTLLRNDADVLAQLEQLAAPEMLHALPHLIAPLAGIISWNPDTETVRRDFITSTVRYLSTLLPLVPMKRHVPDYQLLAPLYREVLQWAHANTAQPLSEQKRNDVLNAFKACRRVGGSSTDYPLSLLQNDEALTYVIILFSRNEALLRAVLDIRPEQRPDVLQSLIMIADNTNLTAADKDAYFRLILEPSEEACNFRYILLYGGSQLSAITMNAIYSVYRGTVGGEPGDNPLRSLCSDLSELTRLHFSREERKLLTEHSINGTVLRRAMRLVENGCATIRNHLNQAAARSDKSASYNEHITSYRRNVYRAIYNCLTAENQENEPEQVFKAATERTFRAAITLAETPLKTALGRDRNYYARIALACLANLFMGIVGLFTLFYHHREHHKKTGEYLFFSQPKSADMFSETSEELRNIMNTTAAPAA